MFLRLWIGWCGTRFLVDRTVGSKKTVNDNYKVTPTACSYRSSTQPPSSFANHNGTTGTVQIR
jgi:hypothetical protein